MAAIVDSARTSEVSRVEQIERVLRHICADVVGVSAAQIPADAHFLEMGFDSFLLLQASQAIQEQTGAHVPLRVMLEEFTNIRSLAEHMSHDLLPAGQVIPWPGAADPAPSPPPSAAPPAAPPPPSVPSPAPMASAAPPALPVTLPNAASSESTLTEGEQSAIERLIAQQLQLMSKQLDLLRNRSGRTSPAAATAAAGPSASRPAVSLPSAAAPALPQPAPPTLSAPSGPSGLSGPSAKDRREAPTFYRPLEEREQGSELPPHQRQHLADLVTRLSQRTAGSKAKAQQYRPFLADNRSSAGFRSLWKEIFYPLVADRAQGARLWDIDGNEYVDISMGFGSLLYGHTPDFLIEAVETQIRRGVLVGPQSNMAGQVAELLCEITGQERAAFVNSGTEAVMGALRCARAVTGRHKIVMFAGSYHGSFDGVLVRGARQADDTLRTMPAAPGIPPFMAENVLMLHFGDTEGLERLRASAHEIAAVLVEPSQSRRPDIEPEPFLRRLREITEELGIALIFDEVITGFRMHPAGVQGLFGIRADITTYGKAVGAGMPIGVVAGKAKFLDAIDGGQWSYGDRSFPRGTTTFFSGTFFKHPLVMAVAWAVLRYLKENSPQLQEGLAERTSGVVETLNRFFAEHGIPMNMINFKSLFRYTFAPEVKYPELFFYYLLEQGVYVWEGRTCYLSTAHTDRDIAFLIEASQKAALAMQAGGFFPTPSGAPSSSGPSPGPSPGPSSGPSGPSGARSSAGSEGTAPAQSLPLTEGQRQLWTLAQLGPDSSRAYNESMSITLRGGLDPGALHRALQELVDRHDALRTTFIDGADGGVVQVVHPRMQLALPLFDLSALPPSAVEAQAATWLEEEIGKPFDLERGPLIRVHLLKRSPEHHQLVITIHHIVTDGYSNGILLGELGQLYTAACDKRPAGLGAPISFGDFVRWQVAQEQTPAYAAARSYWMARFSEPVPPLDLPTLRPRPAVQSFRGARQNIRFEAALLNDIRRFSVQQGVTPFVTLLAGFQILLHRLSGQNDVAVGIASSGQMAHGGPAQGLVGYCVNMLPLRSRIRPGLAFSHYLGTVRRDLLDAQQHQAYPSARLPADLGWPRDPGRPPAFSVVFNMDRRAPSNAFQFQGLDVEVVPNASSAAKFDIFLNAVETPARELLLEFEYNTDLFDGATIVEWSQHLRALLADGMAAPERPVDALSLLTDRQRHESLAWNETGRPYPFDQPLHVLFEAQARRVPGSTALVFDDQAMTYGELNDRANRLAHHLRVRSVGPDALVGLSMERSADMVVAILGILKAGGAYVPLDPTYPSERLAFMAADARISVLVTKGQPGPHLLFEGVEVVDLEHDHTAPAPAPLENPPNRTTAEHLACVFYTSGSTGRPKGVAVPHRAISRLIFNTRGVALGPDDRIAQVSTISFDAASFELWGALLHGGQLLGISRDVMLSPAAFAERLARHHITAMFLTTSLFNQIAQERPDAFRHMRYLLVGGEAATPRWFKAVLDAAGPRHLFNAYGPTESTTFATWHEVSGVAEGEPSLPIGHPIDNTRCHVLDARLEPVPVGVLGELYIGGDGLARGYLNRPELTAIKFVPDPFGSRPGARLYRTGDLVRRRRDGAIEFVRRTDDQVKVRGFRIELGEIETAAKQHPAVQEAAALVQEEERGEKRLVLYMTVGDALSPRTSDDLDLAAAGGEPEPASAPADRDPGAHRIEPALRAHLTHRLPEYMVPSAIVVMKSMPVTQNGKLDRQALPRVSDARPAVEAAFVAPESKTERLLADLWAQALRVDRVGLHDNFFELGGDSILAIRIGARAGEQGLRFTPRQLFQNPTVAQLAQVVETGERAETIEAGEATPQAAPPQTRSRPALPEVPLTPIQRWFLEQAPAVPQDFNHVCELLLGEELDPGALQRAMRAVIAQHDALRLRVQRVEGDGPWRQGCTSDDAFLFTQHDLSALSLPEQEAESERQRAAPGGRLDLSRGPLVHVSYLQCGPGRPNRLLLTVHHWAMDFISWRILLQDLWAAYEHTSRAEPTRLPARTTPFSQWAERLARYARSEEALGELEGWLSMANAAPFAALPKDASGRNTVGSSQTALGQLDAEATHALEEAPKRHRIQVHEVILTAVALAVGRWTGSDHLTLALEGHGREAPFDDVNLSRTVGWFTALYPMRLTVDRRAPPRQALDTVKEQLRRVPRGGIGYGLLRYLGPDDAAARLRAQGSPEISFNYMGRVDRKRPDGPGGWPLEGEIRLQRSPDDLRPYAIEIDALLIGGQLQVRLTYSENLHSRATTNTLAEDVIQHLRALLTEDAQPSEPVVPDFPRSGLSSERQRAFLKKLEERSQKPR